MLLDNALLDDVFVALSDKTRRDILERLFAGEARVTDLAKPYDMSLNSVSKHIRILERARLVTRRRSGRDHFLAFNPAMFDDAAAWMNARTGKTVTTAPAEATPAAAKASELDSFTELMKAEAQTKKKRWSLWGV